MYQCQKMKIINEHERQLSAIGGIMSRMY